MHNVDQRLEHVFRTVFPDLPSEDVRHASANSLDSWDSIAAVTLLNLIEEEFEIQMDFGGDVGHLTSFSSIGKYLQRKLYHTAAPTLA
jgi:acyl carrier protein